MKTAVLTMGGAMVALLVVIALMSASASGGDARRAYAGVPLPTPTPNPEIIDTTGVSCTDIWLTTLQEPAATTTKPTLGDPPLGEGLQTGIFGHIAVSLTRTQHDTSSSTKTSVDDTAAQTIAYNLEIPGILPGDVTAVPHCATVKTPAVAIVTLIQSSTATDATVTVTPNGTKPPIDGMIVYWDTTGAEQGFWQITSGSPGKLVMRSIHDDVCNNVPGAKTAAPGQLLACEPTNKGIDTVVTNYLDIDVKARDKDPDGRFDQSLNRSISISCGFSEETQEWTRTEIQVNAKNDPSNQLASYGRLDISNPVDPPSVIDPGPPMTSDGEDCNDNLDTEQSSSVLVTWSRDVNKAKIPDPLLNDDYDKDGCTDWNELRPFPENLGKDPFNPNDCPKVGISTVGSVSCSDQYLGHPSGGKGSPPDPTQPRTGKTMTRIDVDSNGNIVSSTSVSYLNPGISVQNPLGDKTVTPNVCQDEDNGNQLNTSNKLQMVDINDRPGTKNPNFQVVLDPGDYDSTRSEDGAGPNTCGDTFDNGPDGVADADDADCYQFIELHSTSCSFGEGSGTWNGLETNTRIDQDNPGAKSFGIGTLYITVDSPPDGNEKKCDFSTAEFPFPFTTVADPRTVTKGTPVGPDDDWDGDGCSDWDELAQTPLGRDPFNPNDCDENFDGVFNILVTQQDAEKKYDEALQEDGKGPGTCGDTLDNNGDTVADEADLDCIAVNPGNYFHCIAAVEHEKAGPSPPINSLAASVQCYIDSPALGLVGGSAVPSRADGLAGDPPPPPYTSADPTNLSGSYDKGLQQLTLSGCFEDVGGALGPNIYTVATIDAKSMKGTVDIWGAQSIANCTGGTPNGPPNIAGALIELSEQKDGFDHDGDGCTDAQELAKPTAAKCGDDPYNPDDSDDDVTGTGNLLVTVVRADVCFGGKSSQTPDPCNGPDGINDGGGNDDLPDKTVVGGSYFHCVTDTQGPNAALTIAAYCYTNNPVTAVNCEDAGNGAKVNPALCGPLTSFCDPPVAGAQPPSACGDGLPGSPPPAPYGDVDDPHTVLSAVYDEGTNTLTSSGCFEKVENFAQGPSVYSVATINGQTGEGTVDIWLRQTKTDCLAGTPDGTPDGVGERFIAGALIQTVEQPAGWDTDLDNCTDAQELTNPANAGGVRDPYNRWDWMDQWINGKTDGSIVVGDIGAVVARFGTVGTPGDPKVPPKSQFSYDTQADRGGALVGSAGPWNLKPPDGSIVVGDIGAVVAQFGHAGCAGKNP